jgi:hypothetical protein
VAGFEPTASSSRTKRATKLRHTPLKPGQSIAPGQALAKRVVLPHARPAREMLITAPRGMNRIVGGVVQTRRQRKGWPIMTVLGATIYGGFFGLAALWLFLTADRAEAPQGVDQPNEPVRSNSISRADALVGSSSWSASQSSEK